MKNENKVIIENPDIPSNLSSKLKSFAERSTWHAIPSIAASDRIIVKIVWFIGFTTCIVLCIKNLINLFIDFTNFDVETVVEILRDNDAFFPTVTVCSSLQICGLSDYSFNKYWNLYIQDEFNSSGNLTQDEMKIKVNETLTKFSTSFISDKTVESFLKKYDPQATLREKIQENNKSIRYMVISCQFSSEYCYEMDFEIFPLNYFQRCYKFNSGRNMEGNDSKIRKARRYGKNYGLQLELYIGQQEKCKSPLSSTYGAVVYVHNITENVTENSNGIFLLPGTETNIAIDRTFVKRLSEPHSNCIKNKLPNPSNSNKYIDQTFKLLNGSYSQATCMQLCQQVYNIEVNKCSDKSLPNMESNFQECSIMNKPLYDFFKKNLTWFYSSGKDKICLENCRDECEYVTYQTTVSSSQFPTITYSEVLLYNENVSFNYEPEPKPNFEEVKASVLSLNVYYKTDSYQNIKEKPAITQDVLLSNAGGTLGLFLGASLLSLGEIFEVIYEVLIHFIQRKMVSSKVNVKVQSEKT